MVTDQIADCLTRIRNAQRAGHLFTSMPASKMKASVLDLLVKEGFIAGVEETKDKSGKPQLKVALRYDQYGQPIVKEIKRVSRPGRRIYVGKDEMPKNRGGLGVVVVSTSKGILTDQEARHQGIGGEVICSVF